MNKLLSLVAIGLMIAVTGCLPPPPEAPTFSDPSGVYGMSAAGLHPIDLETVDPFNVIFYTLDGSTPVVWDPTNPEDPNYNMDGLATLSGSIPYVDMTDPGCAPSCDAAGVVCEGVCMADVGACYGVCAMDSGACQGACLALPPEDQAACVAGCLGVQAGCEAMCDGAMAGCMGGCAMDEAMCVAACPPDLTAFTAVGTITMMKMAMYDGCMAACAMDPDPPTCQAACPALLPVAGDETTTISAIAVETAFGQSSGVVSETYTFDPTMHDGDIIVTDDATLGAALGLLGALGIVTIDGDLSITGVMATPIMGVVPPLGILGDLTIANNMEPVGAVMAYIATCTVGGTITTCGNLGEAPCAP